MSIKKGLPSEEAMALDELIGPMPGLRELPPSDPKLEQTTMETLRLLREPLVASGHLAMAEVLNRCEREIQRFSLTPMLHNVRFQVGVAVMMLVGSGAEVKITARPTSAGASEPSGPQTDP